MKRLWVILAMLAILVGVGVSSVSAGSQSFSGTLTPGGPKTGSVAIITTPNCTGGLVAFQVLYKAFPFTVDVSGSYTITEPGTESAVYVYQGSFDPNAPQVNCVNASNTNPISFSASLTAGVPYILVVIEDTFAQDGMTFNAGISGPGNILLPSAACPYPLPSGAAIYSVPAGAPTFFDARLDTQLNFNLPAGTWYITEFTGDFAKVWIGCQAQPFYIPTNAIAR